MMTKNRFLLAGVLCGNVTMAAASEEWRELFNGKDLTGWTTVLEKSEPGEDPQNYVQVRDGNIHMYADTPEDATVPFGVIVHDDTFFRFHISLEYRWREKKFAPRKELLRDAGLLYHIHGDLKIWPDCVESQIQEGDTGDIVFLKSGGLTWRHADPENGPQGQGEPGLLPEDGGYIADYLKRGSAYIGRFPEMDKLEGWNTVEAIVHADESAVNIVNGKVVSRITHMKKTDGTPLKEGKIAVQLEGAELEYRNIRIRELGEPLCADRGFVTLSAVKGQKAQFTTLTFRNPGDKATRAFIKITGADADAFKVIDFSSSGSISADSERKIQLRFEPTRGAGRYSAGLQIGDQAEGTFIVLQGIGLAAFEGKNEPSLQSVVHALGIPLDVGGTALELNTQENTIGQSILVHRFKAADKGKIRITPLMRFSPKGVTPFGIATSAEQRTELGQLANVSEDFPDAHQAIFPPLTNGKEAVEFDAPDTPFAFYMEGHKFISYSTPDIETSAPIPHSGRCWPVSHFQGRELKNAWLIGFEEAANGDYQDSAFLIENIMPAQ